MKKEITTLFLTLTAAFGFAQQIPQATVSTNILEIEPVRPTIEAKVYLQQRSFGYLRMGISDSQMPQNLEQMLPGLGVGYRIAAGSFAYDLSASFNRRQFRSAEGKQRTYQYTLPKANGFYYLTADKNSSLYAGGGLAWAGVKTEDGRVFHGLAPNATVGFEMGRNAELHSFVQLEVSQPAIAASQRGALPKPYAELSLGAGF